MPAAGGSVTLFLSDYDALLLRSDATELALVARELATHCTVVLSCATAAPTGKKADATASGMVETDSQGTVLATVRELCPDAQVLEMHAVSQTEAIALVEKMLMRADRQLTAALDKVGWVGQSGANGLSWVSLALAL